MTLAEKIMSLRKKQGWSQEELAERLNVSRQSVSKWEGEQSVPDITKIIQMSEIFNVSTDYLLKEDKMEENTYRMHTENIPVESEENITASAKGINVTLEEASQYLDKVKKSSVYIALGVMMCIWSPITLIAVSAASECGKLSFTENQSAAIGLTALFVLVAAAVFIFIINGFALSKYDFLNKETINLQYGVEAMVLRKKEAFENTLKLGVAVGVVMIIVSVIPLLAVSLLWEDDFGSALCVGFLLFMVGFAVFIFVKNGLVQESYNKLLQQEDFTKESKAADKKLDGFTTAYWCCVTAVFLAVSFITYSWDKSWIIWPVSAVAFAGIYSLLKHFIQEK